MMLSTAIYINVLTYKKYNFIFSLLRTQSTLTFVNLRTLNSVGSIV